jgi:hypothetical protein
VRTELVAFAMARDLHQIIDDYITPVIDISFGYTLERFAWGTIPGKKTEAITWVPMHTSEISQQPDTENRHSHIADPRASNGIVQLLASIHPHSKLLYLPFIGDEEKRRQLHEKRFLDDGTWQANYATKVVKNVLNAHIIITSTSGVPPKGVYHMPDSDGTEYRFNKASKLIEQQILHNPELRARFGGTILGNIIDRNGNYLEDVREANEQNMFSAHLETLRYLVNDHRQCWLVAGGSHKKVSVLAALRGGLVNRLCIDEEIAHYLLKHAP